MEFSKVDSHAKTLGGVPGPAPAEVKRVSGTPALLPANRAAMSAAGRRARPGHAPAGRQCVNFFSKSTVELAIKRVDRGAPGDGTAP